MVFLMIFCFLIIGCGRPSRQEREAKEKAEREEASRKREQAESELLEQISAKFNPVSFPNEDIQEPAFAYELQHFFKNYMERTILFKAYVEDIEETNEGITVEFISPLRGSLLSDH